MKEWMVGSRDTQHISANWEAFSSYTPIKDDEEVIYLGDSRTTKALGKRKLLLKPTSRKTLALNDVLHIPNIRANMISVALFGKVGVKVWFKYGKIVITKNNVFVGKNYYNQGPFVLNISNVTIKSASSLAYIVDWISLWHARLGHFNVSYIKKMRSLVLLSNINNNNMEKREICA